MSTVRVVRPTPMRTVMAVVRDAAGHTPPVRAALQVLGEVSGSAT